MPRSIWTGAICFGLVTVPVKLYSAVSRKTVRFHQLNGKTGVRIQQRRVDPSTGDEVAYEDIVKGYRARARPLRRHRAGDELDALDPKKTRTIEIEDFVELVRHRPDLLRPPVLPRARRGRRQALPAAARRDARDGQGRDRARRHPLQGAASSRSARWATSSAMSTMLFADEVVDPETHRRAPRGRRRRGRATASSTSPSSSSSRSPATSSPSKYRDDVPRARCSRSSSARPPARRSPCSPRATRRPSPVPDLMAALKASLDAVRAGAGDEATARRKPKKRAAAKPSAKSVQAASRPRRRRASRPQPRVRPLG